MLQECFFQLPPLPCDHSYQHLQTGNVISTQKLYSKNIICPGLWPYKNILHKCKRPKTRNISFSDFIFRFLLLCGKHRLSFFFFQLHEVLMTALTFKISPLTGFKSGTAKGKVEGKAFFINSFLFKHTTTFNNISDTGKTKWNSNLKINKYCLEKKYKGGIW